MDSEVAEKGRLYANKNRKVFVASQGGNCCPVINVTQKGDFAKFRDDYSKGFKVSKRIAKVIFK